MAKKKNNKTGLWLLGGALAFFALRGRGSGSGMAYGGTPEPGYISKYYTPADVTHSDAAMKYDISDQFKALSTPIRDNARFYAANVLDPISDYMGKKVPVDSWYRSEALNNHPSINGAKDSLHLWALATDVVEDDILKDYLRGALIKKIPYHKIIITGSAANPTAVHISLKESGNANQILGKDSQGNYYNIDKNNLISALGLTGKV